jgi:peptidoglycan/LPS O-acetylase OafA/YrhL
MPSKNTGEIRALTSLRGIAAFYIALLHFSRTAQAHAAGPIPALAPRGVLAVDLFFVLSGFIMAYTYLEGFERRGLAAFPDFLGRRIARIMPLNAALLLILSLIVVIAYQVSGQSPFPQIPYQGLGLNLLGNLFLLQGVGIGRNLNGPSWSISDEVIAYLVFPLLLAVVFHRRRIVCGLAVVFSLVVLTIMASKQPYLGMDPTDNGLRWDVARCLTEFSLGLAIYRFHRSGLYPKAFSSDPALFVIATAIIAIMLTRAGDLFAVMLFPFLIVAITRNTGRGRKLLEIKPLHFMGLISFSVYLVHDPIRPLELDLVRFLHPAPLSTPAALTFAALGALSVILPAWITYTLFELPGRTLFRRLLSGSRRPPVVAPVTTAPLGTAPVKTADAAAQ